MRLLHCHGDIVSSSASYAIVQAIAQDANTNKGLAKYLEGLFRMRNEIRSKYRPIPSVVPIYRYGRLILNVVTKRFSRDIPTDAMVYAGLSALRDYTQQYAIRRIAMPEFACGLDRFSYGKLLYYLEILFGNDDIEIIMYHVA